MRISRDLELPGRAATLRKEGSRLIVAEFKRVPTLRIENWLRYWKLREELTLLRLNRHATELDELDVEGILAFAERVLPRAADLWVQASLAQRQLCRIADRRPRPTSTPVEAGIDLKRQGRRRCRAG